MDGRRHLQRTFSTFPGGAPGAGLLLLRGAAGLAALLQGGWWLAHSAFVYGLLAIVCGAALLIGALTPIAAALVGLQSVAVALSQFPSFLPHTKLSAVLLAVIAVALVLLGPGAFSLDARRFGRREINIPAAREK